VLVGYLCSGERRVKTWGVESNMVRLCCCKGKSGDGGKGKRVCICQGG
jgi:hypothetical protein